MEQFQIDQSFFLSLFDVTSVDGRECHAKGEAILRWSQEKEGNSSGQLEREDADLVLSFFSSQEDRLKSQEERTSEKTIKWEKEDEK